MKEVLDNFNSNISNLEISYKLIETKKIMVSAEVLTKNTRRVNTYGQPH